jgi:uncharacterized LabA/DUF88 family protein
MLTLLATLVTPSVLRCPHHRGLASRARRLSSMTIATSTAKRQQRPLYAILVDAENARYYALAPILEEIATMGGDSSVRRVYGDFSKPELSPWKQVSLDLSFRTVNAFSYVSGKGSSDATLIIEAMDYLYSNPTIKGFALVSSDSDFTPLAQRLREAGKHVIGFGERRTPSPFVTACERFIYTENLLGYEFAAKTDTGRGPPIVPQSPAAALKRTLEPSVRELLCKAIDDAVDDSTSWAYLSAVGGLLRTLRSDFDVRSYGHKTLRGLLEAHPELFSLKPTGVGGSAICVQLKSKRNAMPLSANDEPGSTVVADGDSEHADEPVAPTSVNEAPGSRGEL